jgi:curli biogenesis system outer membrane secretion channel CsgG
VAILEFDYGAVKLQWPAVQSSRRSQQPVMPTLDTLDVGRGIANLLVTELATSGELRLIERQRLADLARERQGGEEVSARYLVMGTVTRFGGEQKTRGGMATKAIALATRVPILLLFKLKETLAYVNLSYRVVDATTSEIVKTGSSAGQSRRRGLLVGGLGANRGMTGAGLSVDSAEFQATILGEATASAVKDAATQLRVLLAGVS